MSSNEPDWPVDAEPGLAEESTNGTVPHDEEPAEVETPAHEAPAEESVTEDEPGTAPVVGGDLPPLASALEAVLMIVDEPVPTVQLAQVLETPRAEVDATLRSLAEEYTAAGRGFDLREVAGGWRYYSRTECAPVVERFVLDGQQARLTQAALETLAVVAYRQPVSRARVSAIRGVNCDGVIRTLVSRGLIEEAGTEQESNAFLYRTTSYFLERIDVQSVDDLPDIAPYLPEIDELADTEDVAG